MISRKRMMACINKHADYSDELHTSILSLIEDAAPCEQAVRTFPYEDSIIFTAKADDTLIGLLAFSPMDEESYEACAYVVPSHRNQGIFASLMKAASETIEDYDILWQVSEENRTGLAVMEAIGAEMECENLMMKLNLMTDDSDYAGHAEAAVKNLTFDLKNDTYYFLQDDVPIGLCRIAPAGASSNGDATGTVCFYDFEIDEAYRGKGLGANAFSLVRKDLQEKGWQTVILHVEGDNEPAVRLYQKQGFQITERVFTWLY